ncbi:MAG: D-alanine--D-alanine ligase [Firmicutes bacterium]|jgi:D-alanine-D-alanine ligase|nr:D-alanine--D-alanine ligase [Bacillota bacterium]
MKRKKVAVIFGGRSGEHIVSLKSARSIMEAIDRERYTIIPVGISRDGTWLTGDRIWDLLWEQRDLRGAPRAAIFTDPRQPGLLVEERQGSSSWSFVGLDLIFPVLHGPYGEDGTVQGLFELTGIPYVGSGVLSSAVAMDKAVMKILFQQHDLPVGPYLYFNRREWQKEPSRWIEQICSVLKLPCFVKPANLGSSIGISKVNRVEELGPAIDEALLYDDKVIVEALLKGKEIECSVLGDLEPRASRPGEIIPCNEFYDYTAKYLDERSELIYPAELKPALEEKVRELACQAFTAVEASGLARVDFFVDEQSSAIFINEINTMPGFTDISMYPKLWEVSGVGYRELVGRLMKLAEDRFARRRELLTAPPE